MKIIHCADLHLDSQMTANLTKEQARERKREIIRTFTRMVEYAEKTGVRLIMISGDLFDTRNVSALARNTVRDMICTHPQIDFLYLRGTMTVTISFPSWRKYRTICFCFPIHGLHTGMEIL